MKDAGAEPTDGTGELSAGAAQDAERLVSSALSDRVAALRRLCAMELPVADWEQMQSEIAAGRRCGIGR